MILSEGFMTTDWRLAFNLICILAIFAVILALRGRFGWWCRPIPLLDTISRLLLLAFHVLGRDKRVAINLIELQLCSSCEL